MRNVGLVGWLGFCFCFFSFTLSSLIVMLDGTGSGSGTIKHNNAGKDKGASPGGFFSGTDEGG